MDTVDKTPRELPVREIGTGTDTRDILAQARRQADVRNFDDVFIVDIDSHHNEAESWSEIMQYVEDDVVRGGIGVSEDDTNVAVFDCKPGSLTLEKFREAVQDAAEHVRSTSVRLAGGCADADI